MMQWISGYKSAKLIRYNRLKNRSIIRSKKKLFCERHAQYVHKFAIVRPFLFMYPSIETILRVGFDCMIFHLKITSLA